MITDAFASLTQSPATLLTGNANAQISADAIDIRNERNLGEGQPIYAVFQLTAAMVGAGASLAVNLWISSSSSGALANEQYLCGASFGAVSAAGSTVATMITPAIFNNFSSGSNPDLRYLRLQCVSTGATLTSASVIVNLVPHLADGKLFYPSGWTVPSL
jgi:hypothetical protein